MGKAQRIHRRTEIIGNISDRSLNRKKNLLSYSISFANVKIDNKFSIKSEAERSITTVGAYGMEDGIGNAFFVADDAEGFARIIINILTDNNMYMILSKQAYEISSNLELKNQKTSESLISVK